MADDEHHERKQRQLDRLLQLALLAIVGCLLIYATMIASFTWGEVETGHPAQRSKKDPLPPAKPFIWGTPPQIEVVVPDNTIPDDLPSTRSSSDRGERPARLSEPAALQEVEDLPAEAPADEVYAYFAGPDASKVRRATFRALNRGETQIWTDAGQRGYVLVSPPRQDASTECRQVRYTLFDADTQSLSPPMQWCRAGGNRWRPN